MFRSNIVLFTSTLLIAFSFTQCKSQAKQVKNKLEISIHPDINPEDESIKRILGRIVSFLKSKDENPRENKYWDPDDFEKYPMPFYDIYNWDINRIQSKKWRTEILPFQNWGNERKIRIANYRAKKDSLELRSIFNFLAVYKNDNWYFKRILEHNTADWEKLDKDKIEFIISPTKKINLVQVNETLQFSDSLKSFFGIEIPKLKYYSFFTPEELFRARGFDHHSFFYKSKTGGQNETWSNIIYSANNSERYDHELVHSFTYHKFKQRCHPLLDEGIATLLGGSSEKSVYFHLKTLNKYLKENPETNILDHLNPHGALEINELTNISYAYGALLCQLIIDKKSKEALFQIMNAGRYKGDFLNALKLQTGITCENIEENLRTHLSNYLAQNK